MKNKKFMLLGNIEYYLYLYLLIAGSLFNSRQSVCLGAQFFPSLIEIRRGDDDS